MRASRMSELDLSSAFGGSWLASLQPGTAPARRNSPGAVPLVAHAARRYPALSRVAHLWLLVRAAGGEVNFCCCFNKLL